MQVDYIHVIQMPKDNVYDVVGLPDMMSDFKEVTRGTLCVVYYDTTFCMGDFYVSALLYRSTVFVGHPVMPLMLMLHERRMTDSHALMFNWFSKLSSMIKIVCVSDREAAITNAIHAVLPDASMVTAGITLLVMSGQVIYRA